jgi:hypothetical protein
MNPFFGSGRTLKSPFTKDFEQPGIRIMVPVESIGISQEAFATLINTGSLRFILVMGLAGHLCHLIST